MSRPSEAADGSLFLIGQYAGETGPGHTSTIGWPVRLLTLTLPNQACRAPVAWRAPPNQQHVRGSRTGSHFHDGQTGKAADAHSPNQPRQDPVPSLPFHDRQAGEAADGSLFTIGPPGVRCRAHLSTIGRPAWLLTPILTNQLLP